MYQKQDKHKKVKANIKKNMFKNSHEFYCNHYNPLKATDFKTNKYYAEILQNLYMGQYGEVVSFLQFFYENSILTPFNNYFGNIFNKIAIEDLSHMQELAKAIILLGGDPIYANSGKFLGGRSIAYNKDIKSMLLNNVELKENSIIAYKTTMLKIEDKNILRILETILKEEENHLQLLKQQYSVISKQQINN